MMYRVLYKGLPIFSANSRDDAMGFVSYWCALRGRDYEDYEILDRSDSE